MPSLIAGQKRKVAHLSCFPSFAASVMIPLLCREGLCAQLELVTLPSQQFLELLSEYPLAVVAALPQYTSIARMLNNKENEREFLIDSKES